MTTKENTPLAKQLRRVNVRSFLTTFIILLLIGSVPGLAAGGTNHITGHDVFANAGWYFGYWFVIAALVSAFSAYQKYRSYDKPIAALSEAMKQVAAGDFSVYVDATAVKSRNPYFARMIGDFNVMVRELGSLETLKSDFVSTVSHELKTPLAVMQNYATFLQQADLPEAERQQYLREIASASDELAQTVSNILLLNKLDNQGIMNNATAYNLTDQLAEILMSLESLFDEKALDVQVELADRVPVSYDRNVLAIVWRNLLTNAIKFSNRGGVIRLTQTQANDGTIVVTVRDNGIGMSPETLHHLFDKFYQAETARSVQGNGLGLALVKRVLDNVEGSITVTSAEGAGSEFVVRISNGE